MYLNCRWMDFKEVMGVFEKGIIVRKFVFTLAREEISQRTGSIVSFRPTSLSTHIVDFFRWPSRVFAFGRPETRKLQQTLPRVNSIAFDQKLSFSLKGLRSGSTGSINGTSVIYLFLRFQRRRSRCEITTFNYSRSTSFVFPPSVFRDAPRPQPRI